MVRPTVVTFATLLASSCLSVLLIFFRLHYSPSTFYIFLVWNLFLAWIPYIVSLALYLRYQQTRRLTVLMLFASGVWLLFYPNAPYLLTDLIHLKQKIGVPLWFDVLMFFSFVWNGLLLGFLSLYQMQHIVKMRRGHLVGWMFVVASLTITSLGVYLGRFLRWNSWDILSNPVTLAKDAVHPLIHPLAYSSTLKITSIYTVFFILAYLMFYAFTHLHSDSKN